MHLSEFLSRHCPNFQSLEYCHLSDSTFRILSFVRIGFHNIVICPKGIFRILSFVRKGFLNFFICPNFLYPCNMQNTRKIKLEIETRIQIGFNFELKFNACIRYRHVNRGDVKKILSFKE